MKTLIFLLLGIFIFSVSSLPQWNPQLSGTSKQLYTSYFHNENLGWAAGSDGAIYKTTDAGSNWISHSLATDDNVHSIFFIDSLNGWLTLYEFDPIRHGSVYSTTDGGLNWVEQLTVNGYCLLSVNFINSESGWVVGTNGIAFKTIDGGNNWEPASLPTAEWLFDVFFIDEHNGWVSGGMDWIYRTTDSGNTWINQNLPVSDRIMSLFFMDEQVGWICGAGGRILRSTNGGLNWLHVPSPVIEELRRVVFIDSLSGWIVGLNGRILHSTDGGNEWNLQNSGTNSSLYSVNFVDELVGWVVGENGTILSTLNGGVPVELYSFDAEVSGSMVNLTWITATEINNSGFELERKIVDNWEKVAFIEGYGTTTISKYYFYTDDLSSVAAGNKIYYRLKQIDYDGTFSYSDELEVEYSPASFEVFQNYPNPFNPTTTIKYSLPKQSKVLLEVYNLMGQSVEVLVNDVQSAGNYSITFDAGNQPAGRQGLASGIYYYRFITDYFNQTRKMLLLK